MLTVHAIRRNQEPFFQFRFHPMDAFSHRVNRRCYPTIVFSFPNTPYACRSSLCCMKSPSSFKKIGDFPGMGAPATTNKDAVWQAMLAKQRLSLHFKNYAWRKNAKVRSNGMPDPGSSNNSGYMGHQRPSALGKDDLKAVSRVLLCPWRFPKPQINKEARLHIPTSLLL